MPINGYPGINPKKETLVLLVVVALSIGFFLYVNIFHGIDIVYTHFFYLPIILASMWRYKQALILAASFGIIHIMAGFYVTGGLVPGTVVRSAMFLIIAYVVGEIAEKKDRFFRQYIESTKGKKLILDAVTEGIIGIDTNGSIIFANHAALSVTGFSEEDIMGRPHSIITYQEAATEATIDYSKCETEKDGKGGKGWGAFKAVFLKKDKTEFTVEYTVTPIIEEKQVKGTVVVFRDISEKIRVDTEMARLDRLDTIGKMAGSMAHEIRNPMTTVRGFLQLLRKGELNLKQKEYIDVMVEELDRANGILVEYLSLSKKNVGIFETKNLNSILRRMAPLINAKAINSGKKIEFSLGELDDLLIDEKEIRQLVVNLVNNGLESMAPGGKLTIKTLSENGRVILLVSDQGTGIKKEVLKKIGTPFFTTKDTGTGLGMAVCLNIIENHGAQMDIDTSNEGTTFFVCFPVNSQDIE